MGRKTYTSPAITEIGRLHEVVEASRNSNLVDGDPFDTTTGQIPAIPPESF